MMNCWAKLPDERPSFSDIVSTISSYTELVAGYLDISCYNPFESIYASIDSDATATGSSDNDRDTIANSASTEQLVHNADSGNNINSDNSDRKKQRALSKSSSCASPQASPMRRFSKLKDEEPSTASNACVEIQVQSPLQDDIRTPKV